MTETLQDQGQDQGQDRKASGRGNAPHPVGESVWNALRRFSPAHMQGKSGHRFRTLHACMVGYKHPETMHPERTRSLHHAQEAVPVASRIWRLEGNSVQFSREQRKQLAAQLHSSTA
jgi:hypothetical protein